MKRLMIAATAALLTTTGCATPEPGPNPAAATPETTAASGAVSTNNPETAYDKQVDAWLVECHDILDAERDTTHDISWEHSVSLDGNEHRLIGTATQARGDIAFPVMCEVDSDWNVTLDTNVGSSKERGDGVYVFAKRTEDNARYQFTKSATAESIEECFDSLAGEYSNEAVLVYLSDDVDQGGAATIGGTAKGEAGVESEFWCQSDGPSSAATVVYHGPVR